MTLDLEQKKAPKDSLLASNLHVILTELHKHSIKYTSHQNIKNVLLFFYNKNKSTYPKIVEGFKVVSIDYSDIIIRNFVNLD